MSMQMYLKIERRFVSNELLEDILKKHFCCDSLDRLTTSNTVSSYEDFYEKYGIIITLIDEAKPPYNIHDTPFLSEEFIYEQVISFYMDKTREFSGMYKTILGLVFHITENYTSRSIVTTDFSQDFCLLNGGKEICVNPKMYYLLEDVIKEYSMNLVNAN